MENVEKYERELAKEMLDVLEQNDAIIYGSKTLENHSALFSFGIKGARAHDVCINARSAKHRS